jgi:hypothetical protein
MWKTPKYPLSGNKTILVKLYNQQQFQKKESELLGAVVHTYNQSYWAEARGSQV